MATLIDVDGLLHDALVHERQAEELERYPRFDGNEEAQRLWLGDTDADRAAELRRRARVMRNAVREQG